MRIFSETLEDGINVSAGYKARAVRGGMSRSKGWFMKTESARVTQRSHGGALANVERTYDRDRDRYSETVTLCETGEVIHKTDEPLSKHTGHGSAKR